MTRHLRVRQGLVTVALAAPLVVAMAMAPPFVEAPGAQGPMRMLGPNFPIRIDSNGNGPGTGDGNIVPGRSGNAVTIPSQWACGNTGSNVITLSNADGTGRFRTASRANGLRQQSVTISTFVNGSPREFAYTETRPGQSNLTGGARLLDQSLDGIPDAVAVNGLFNGTVSLTVSADGGYISIPWAQASIVGIETSNTCAGAVPQLWIPLADTNGDGRGDTIIPDLDGNGVADGDVYTSPIIAAPAVPTMGAMFRLALLVLLGLTGAWFLSHRSRNDYGTTAGV